MYGFILNLMALRGEPACSPFMKLFIAFPDWVRYIFWQPQFFGNPRLPPGAIHIQPLRGCAV